MSEEKEKTPYRSELKEKSDKIDKMLADFKEYLEMKKGSLSSEDVENIRVVVYVIRSVLKEDMSLHSREHVSEKLKAMKTFSRALSRFTSQSGMGCKEFSQKTDWQDLIEEYRNYVKSMT